MSIIVKKGDVNIQNYVEPGGTVKNVYKGPVNFGSGTIEHKSGNGEISDERVKEALDRVKAQITSSRLWFAIYRPLVMVEKIKNGMFEQFKVYVESLMTELPKPIDPHDLQSKMDVECFKKDVSEWNPDKAPVKGKTFMSYYNLAIEFLELLNNDEEDDIDESEE